MERYELLLNSIDAAPLYYPAEQANDRIKMLESELAAALQMVSVLKSVVIEQRLVIHAAAMGGRL